MNEKLYVTIPNDKVTSYLDYSRWATTYNDLVELLEDNRGYVGNANLPGHTVIIFDPIQKEWGVRNND